MKCLTGGNWKKRDCNKETDYKKYHLSFFEIIKVSVAALAVSMSVSFLFYNSKIIWLVMLMPIEFMMIKVYRERLCKKRSNQLRMQFKDMCVSISSSLSTGVALENAVVESEKEMIQIYGRESYIVDEIEFMKRKINLSVQIEKIFSDLAERSGIEEVVTFSQILTIAQRTGGDLIGIMKKTADNIGEKLEVEREIASIINSKKFEMMIMNAVPVLIIMYMRLTSGDIIKIMYISTVGRVVMTVCLLVYMFTLWIGQKVTDIGV